MGNFKTSAIILAGGIGSRMQTDKTKQFINILGKTVIERTVSAFEQSDKIDEQRNSPFLSKQPPLPPRWASQVAQW